MLFLWLWYYQFLGLVTQTFVFVHQLHSGVKGKLDPFEGV